jgi:alpha-galactosidase
MPAIPNFVLKRLYVKGSLANTADGCELALRNFVGSGTMTGLLSVEVDGRSHLPDVLSVGLPEGVTRPGDSITPESPLVLASGVAVTIRLRGERLSPGPHAVRLRILTGEMGQLDIGVSDAVREKLADEHAVTEPVPMAGTGTLTRAASRPLKVAIIGAGSAVFARQLMTDILTTPGLTCGTFALVDVDPGRLSLAKRIGEKMARASGRSWRVEASRDRRRALPGCDYVISCIEVAGLRNVRNDYDIPLKYGVDQCIGDTIGPGGIFKMLRTGPAWLEILRDIEKLCPRAVVMNYTNPMSALTLLALRATGLRVVGLCHSVQGTCQQLADYLELPVSELRWRCAGINHLAWFTELTHEGRDMYPRLRERAADPEVWDADPVRFEMMKYFGAFCTESSGHLSEYLPYFRKKPSLIQMYTRGGYRGESGFYADNWPGWRAAGDDSIRELLGGRSPLALQRSEEYASTIIEAIECGGPAVIHGNVLNTGLIDNLPGDGCVEAPVLVDSSGLSPAHFGPLPAQLAALDRAHMAVHELMVDAVRDRDLDAARHALLLDPLTAAVLSPAEISAMFDEMVSAERADLAYFRP